MEFEKGQKVVVSYTATVDRVAPEGGFNIADPGGVYLFIQPHQIGPTGYTVEIADPENWPPQVGDIWAADGTEWFVRETANGYPYGVWFVPVRKETGRAANEMLPLSPVLVRRRGQLWLPHSRGR